MSTFNENPERRVIPRWRDSATTLELCGFAALPSRASHKVSTPGSFQRRVDEWHDVPALPFAADLVSAGIVLGRTAEVREAAEFILNAAPHASEAAQRLARFALGHTPEKPVLEEVEDTLCIQIHSLRERLRFYPRNPLMWVDLARAHVLLGNNEKAERAMRSALTLAPNDRFVLRSASRLRLHSEDAKAALRILRRSPATSKDPWLLAAEVSLATLAGQGPRFLAEARHLVRSQRLSPWHLNELCGALATLEVLDGSHKQAKHLFAQALARPTENTVAQAQWAARRIRSLVLPAQAYSVPRAFEAQSWNRFDEGDWPGSLAYVQQWLNDEPFSTRPAEMGSFIAVVLIDDYATCVELAHRGLLANPDNQTLRNNIVFALASQGRISEALAEASRVRVGYFAEGHEIAWTATRGLLAFRQGDIDRGRQLYLRAIEDARNAPLTRGYAAAFLAREEIVARTSQARSALQFATEEARSVVSNALATLLKRIAMLAESEAEGSRPS